MMISNANPRLMAATVRDVLRPLRQRFLQAIRISIAAPHSKRRASTGLKRLIRSDEHAPVNIGNPEEYTILQLAEAVRGATGSASEIVYEALPQDDPAVRQPDISRAREILGWEPTVGLADGLRMRVATPADLIVLKLAAAAEPRRRASKRQHDLADVVALMEEYPDLRTPETLARLRDVRLSLQALDDA